MVKHIEKPQTAKTIDNQYGEAAANVLISVPLPQDFGHGNTVNVFLAGRFQVRNVAGMFPK